ncbi:hypothetical protein [Arthrobacter sp. JUb115]|uniref:hypothetical protein n=1 Tax=Arthrobacter sp. JUb115 TaxID=2485108 RepID=UPI00105FE67E|nr:hypothetical protein [Arthrobacter sp. JUb115]TDU27108.1 hypothetical protein EDF61_104184 [Arthrobacter sp. JUb115]
MSDWRFHLLTVPDGEWVDRDLQLQKAKVSDALSAPQGISGELPLGYRMLKTPTGKPGLSEWGSAIVAEQEGRDPIFAIVDGLNTEGDWLKVQAGGFTSYPMGMPWVDSEYSSTRVDALDVVRLIWARIQSKANGDLGVVVDATKSGIYLGKPEGAVLTKAKEVMASKKARMDALADQAVAEAEALQYFADSTFQAAGMAAGGLLIKQASAPSGDKRSKKNLWFKGNSEGITALHKWDGRQWVEVSTAQFDAAIEFYFEWEDRKPILAVAKANARATKEAYNEAKSRVSDLSEQEAAPYTLNWWETTDLGSVLTDLATQTPFDYREETVWDGDDALSHRLILGYPDIGVKREDLRLEIGVNVTAPPPLDEADFASEVVVLGAGEGRATVRATATNNTGRLRRVAVVERKELSKTSQATAQARIELAARTSDWTFEDLELLDHPMCPYGSFDAGDWLYLTGDAGWAQIDQWVRVMSIDIDCPTGRMSLKVSSN